MIRELICINCPRGCHLSVDMEKMTVSGNSCPRGAAYGLSEVTHPVRVVTSTVILTGGRFPRLPVKTSKPIPKEMIFKVMGEINKASFKAPSHVGDVVIKNVLDTGADVLATAEIGKGD